MTDESGHGAVQRTPWIEQGHRFRWVVAGIVGASAAALGIYVAVAPPDNWGVCDDAMKARLVAPLDYDATGVTWVDSVDGTRVAHGVVHAGDGATYSFECGVTNHKLDWLDLK